MKEQELIQKLSSLKDEIQPSSEWLEQSEKELLNQLPKSQWPIYSLVVVLVLGFIMVGAIHESPDVGVDLASTQEHVGTGFTPAHKEMVSKLDKAKERAQSIKKELAKSVQKQEQVLATKIKQGEESQTDARVKLLEDIEGLENIEEVSGLLEKAKQEFEQGNFVITQELVRQAQEILDNLSNK